ncbi:ABC transporter substrate-binding protein [Petropleomorpha daqingensis]|uniref:Branched-chain amino acid transport system substrate-binding protein n=1 Tax=Petropleomorpha daqingensis TaxID=2026353 RepID=A0A853CAB6_9ACTN|nr:ABC transporter substrate-binding protein [Petropleomorpha daqingensis]NYJ04119.1 branched-chain amino acid transport system substrate-binding protein [Petropleomorpha daqingensis]
MRNSRNRLAGSGKVVAVVGAAVLALTACGGGGGSSSSSSETAAAPADAPEGAIKIGVLTTCGGPFATFEAESLSGAKYALIKDAGGKADGQKPQDQVTGATIAGKPIAVSYGCSDATPDKAVAEARRLVENVGVQILLGPLSGDEGVAVANYAKSHPDVTFVNGTSGAQSTTLSVQAPNFFRFGGDGAQWMAGLGTYAYKTLGWKKVAILGEDYSYPYTQAAGFVSEFTSLGGEVTARSWVPLTQTDWSSPVAQLPRDVDGVLLLTGGTNTVAAEKAFIQIGKDPGKFLLGGSSVMDPTSFTVGDQLEGLVGGSPVPLGGTDAEWKGYVDGFTKEFPDVPGDSLFTVLYYDGMEAILQGLDQVKGDLSDKSAAFQQALTGLKPTFPNGQVSLDANRNSVQPAYVVQIVKDGGQLGFKVVETIDQVDQTFGGLFSADSPDPSRDEPAKATGNPPPWSNG